MNRGIWTECLAIAFCSKLAGEVLALGKSSGLICARDLNKKYNIKVWLAVVVSIVAVSPFVWLNAISDGPLDHFDRRFDRLDMLIASFIGFTFFGAIVTSQAFARFCARDPARLSETIDTARYCSVICGLIFVLSVVFYFI